MIKKFGGNLRLGLFARLGNITIIQVLFIFAALAIIFYFPTEENLLDSEYNSIKNQFNQLSKQLVKVLNEDLRENENLKLTGKIRKEFTQIIDTEKIIQSLLFIKGRDNNTKKIFTLRDNNIENIESDITDDFNYIIENNILKNKIISADGLLIPLITNIRYSIYYYQFKLDDNENAILVSIIDHNFIVSHRPRMMYTLLILFLASSLVSLLMIYLLNKRFQEPLKRLINGFEKTAQGELYYLVETDGDSELIKLSTAFNNMSKTLRINHKKLRNYNTQLKETNIMLSESQEFLKTMIDSSPSSIIATLSDGEIIVFNQKASEVFGFDQIEIIGKNIKNLFTHSLEEIEAQNEHNETGYSFEILCRRKDKSFFPAYIIFSPITGKNEQESANLYIIKDISESKSYQQMMIRLDRYYTRGEMAGDIAHEINNFLAILSGNVELIPLYIRKQEFEKLDKKLEIMKTTIDKIARFTDGLMDVNEDNASFDKVDLNQLIETVLAFLKPQNKFDEIDVKTSLAVDIPLVEVDISQIQQLLVNLIYNASDSLAEKETNRNISISSQLVKKSGEQNVIIEVHDNGPGVSKDKEHLLFKKRFTSKRKGHGIGLITCKKIIDAHNGSIAYKYDKGAAFYFELPVNQQIILIKKSESETSQVST